MKSFILILILSIITLFASQSNANWKDSIKPFQNLTHPPLEPTKLTYTMSWKGAIDSGVMTMEFGKKDPRYPKAFISHINGNSTGIAAKLFPYTFTFTSFATPQYKPIIFVTNEKDDKEIVDIKNQYKSPGAIHHSSSNRLKKNKIKTLDYNFDASLVHDAVTAMLHVRGQPLNKADTVHLCILPFKSPYYGKITVLGREKHAGRDCIKLDIHLSTIDRDNGKLKKYDKLKNATMWISDDKQRIPIELRSEVFIGDVRAVLTKQEKILN